VTPSPCDHAFAERSRERLRLGLQCQLTKFGPGGGSSPHSHADNHAFYFLSGTCTVQIGEQTWHVEPGTLVKVPAYERHSVTNTGTESSSSSTTRLTLTTVFRSSGPVEQ
jgi:quercetin dioxygenase-like cupin family protein